MFIKGRASKQEVEDIRKGDIGSMLLHRASGIIIVSAHRIANIEERQCV